MLTALVITSMAAVTGNHATAASGDNLYLGGAYVTTAGGANYGTGGRWSYGVGVALIGRVEDGVLTITACHDPGYEWNGADLQILRERTGAPREWPRSEDGPIPSYWGDNVGEGTLAIVYRSGPPKPGENTVLVTVQFVNTFRDTGWWVSNGAAGACAGTAR
ncbi:hypothetical protein DOE63_32765 (plasmid) [Salmonella enterica subsp. diarizonae serovar 59:z10:-]|nr:hypothetical protein DOE63_32765 [Salmonella enterica subsp. diarizonae serovar 59:z10:-]